MHPILCQRHIPQKNPYLSLSVRLPHVIPCYCAPLTRPMRFSIPYDIHYFFPKKIIKDWKLHEDNDSILLLLIYGYLRDLLSVFDHRDLMLMIKDFAKQGKADVFMNLDIFKPGDIILTSSKSFFESRNLYILNFQNKFHRIYGKYICNFRFDDWHDIYIVIPLHITKYLTNAVLFFSNVDTNIIIMTSHFDPFVIDNLSGMLNICYKSIEIWLSRRTHFSHDGGLKSHTTPQRIVIALTNHWQLIIEKEGLTYWNASDIEDIDDVLCIQSSIFKKYINYRQDIQIPTICYTNKVMKLTWQTKLLYENYIEEMQYEIVKLTNQIILNHRLACQYH